MIWCQFHVKTCVKILQIQSRLAAFVEWFTTTQLPGWFQNTEYDTRHDAAFTFFLLVLPPLSFLLLFLTLRCSNKLIKTHCFALSCACWVASKNAKLATKRPRLAPRCFHVGLKSRNWASKTAKNGPNILQLDLQEPPQSRPKLPKWLQNAPRWIQDPPRCL